MDQQDNTAMQEAVALHNKHKSGSNWFFFIAGLSVVNSIIMMTGGELNFIVGLGVTQVLDGIARAIAAESPDIGPIVKAIVFTINLFVAAVFVTFGIFARKMKKWSFVTGMILYGLDGLIFLLVQDILSIGFHGFALYCMYNGMKASRQLQAMAESMDKPEAETGCLPCSQPRLQGAKEPLSGEKDVRTRP